MKSFFLIATTIIALNFAFSQTDTAKFACYSTISKLIEDDSLAKANLEFDKCTSLFQEDFFFSYLKGLLFLKKKEFDSAKNEFTNSIKKLGVVNELNFVQLALADAFIGSKEYDKALLVLDSIKLYAELHSRFNKIRDMHFRKAQCFVGLNNIDAAISILTPFIFSGNGSKEGQKTKEVILYYKETLLKKYKLNAIKKALRTSIKKITIENTFLSEKTSLSDTSYKHEWRHKSYTYVLNTEVILKSLGYVYFNKANFKVECPSEFKRKAIEKIIKDSFFYTGIFKKKN
jgi:tetratricopeptide (TPR) repeat protein